METELTLSKGGVPPFSARGCTQILSCIPLGTFQRTVTHNLVYLGKLGKKYRSTIKCQDLSPIATDDLSPGVILEVGCIQRIYQTLNADQCTLERIPLEGSICVMDKDQNLITDYMKQGQDLHFRKVHQGFINYRPLLTMQVKSYTLTTDEWGLKVGWQLELEEV